MHPAAVPCIPNGMVVETSEESPAAVAHRETARLEVKVLAPAVLDLEEGLVDVGVLRVAVRGREGEQRVPRSGRPGRLAAREALVLDLDERPDVIRHLCVQVQTHPDVQEIL